MSAKPKRRTRRTSKSPKKTGRPKGRKTATPSEVVTLPGRCRKCGSTERTAYYDVVTRQLRGEIDGQPYNRIRWRRTQCKSCRQNRVEQSFEFDPALD